LKNFLNYKNYTEDYEKRPQRFRNIIDIPENI